MLVVLQQQGEVRLKLTSLRTYARSAWLDNEDDAYVAGIQDVLCLWADVLPWLQHQRENGSFRQLSNLPRAIRCLG